MQGLLMVISGFSGVGKGTLVKELLKRYPDDYALSISATTRKPRTGEVDGKDYFFISREEFEEKIQRGELLEHTEYNGNCYGTPKDYVLNKLKAGINIILEIDVEGGLNVRKQFPEDSVLIFLVPPSAKELRNRLLTRGTETMAQIEGRLRRSVEEINYLPNYDFVIANEDFEDCLSKLHAMMSIQKESLHNRQILVPELKTELKEVVNKGE